MKSQCVSVLDVVGNIGCLVVVDDDTGRLDSKIDIDESATDDDDVSAAASVLIS